MITILPTWLSISNTMQNSFTVSSVGGTRGVPHGAPTSSVSGLCPFHKLSASTRASMAPARVQLPDTTRRVSGFSSKPCSIFCSALQIRSHNSVRRQGPHILVHVCFFDREVPFLPWLRSARWPCPDALKFQGRRTRLRRAHSPL